MMEAKRNGDSPLNSANIRLSQFGVVDSNHSTMPVWSVAKWSKNGFLGFFEYFIYQGTLSYPIIDLCGQWGELEYRLHGVDGSIPGRGDPGGRSSGQALCPFSKTLFLNVLARVKTSGKISQPNNHGNME